MHPIKIGISTFLLQKEYGDMEALRIAKTIGADAVDFTLDDFRKTYDVSNPESVYSRSDEEIVHHFIKIKEYAEKLGLEICQTHGRAKGFVNNKEKDDILIENARRDLLVTSVLGAPVCVLHAVTTIYMGPNCDPKLMHDLNFDMFTRMIPFAKQYGVKVATETFGDAVKYNACDFFGNIDEFIKSYNRICAVDDFKDYFTICVDTGHSNKATRFNNNPSSADVIRMLGENVTVLHLNDNDTLTDQHKIPLSGTIDWEDVFQALKEIDYQGVYNLEVQLKCFGDNMMKETAEFAVKVMRNYISDFYKKKAYLFDFDGTLVDSMPTFVTAMLRILDEHHIPYENDIVKIITPLGMDGTAEYFIEMGLDLPKEKIMLLMKEYMMEEYVYHIPAKNNVISVLETLKERGANLNVLTASPHVTLDACLKRLGIYDLFTHVWSCDDFSTTKSNPEIYKIVAKKIGTRVENVLFLDDNYHADKTAKAAGMKVCGVYDDSSKEYIDEIKGIADYYIYDFSELLDLEF